MGVSDIDPGVSTWQDGMSENRSKFSNVLVSLVYCMRLFYLDVFFVTPAIGESHQSRRPPSGRPRA
jgi:hypothetical protein